MSAEGLGCMGMTWAYGSGDEQSGIETIHRALELSDGQVATLDRAVSPESVHGSRYAESDMALLNH